MTTNEPTTSNITPRVAVPPEVADAIATLATEGARILADISRLDLLAETVHMYRTPLFGLDSEVCELVMERSGIDPMTDPFAAIAGRCRAICGENPDAVFVEWFNRAERTLHPERAAESAACRAAADERLNADPDWRAQYLAEFAADRDAARVVLAEIDAFETLAAEFVADAEQREGDVV